MSISLAGSHRSGKTFLAQTVAAKCSDLGMVFVPSRGSEVFANLGFDVNQALRFEERMAVQELILDLHVADVSAAGKFWISDRSSLDMAAYALAEWGKTVSGAANQQRLVDYVDRCFEVSNTHYAALVVLQPGIPFVVADGKPAPNKAFEALVNNIIIGSLFSPKLVTRYCVAAVAMTDLQARVNLVLHMWNMLVEQTAREKACCYVH